MWKNYILLLLILSMVKTYAQPGFNQIYFLDSMHAEGFESLVVDNDTIVVMRAGYDSNVENWGMNLLKLDTFGNILQSYFLSDTVVRYNVDSGGNRLVKTPDGGYAFSVNVHNDTSCVSPCINLAKFNHDLELEFNRHYSAPMPSSYFSANKILALADGGFFLVGTYLDQTANLNSFRTGLIRTDEVGEIQWIKEYALVDTAFFVVDILSDEDTCFLISGVKVLFGNPTVFNPFNILIDSLGTPVKTWWGEQNTGERKSVKDDENGYLQVGGDAISLSNGSTKSKPYIRKVDSLFNEQWKRSVDVPFISGASLYYDLLHTPDGHYVGVGGIPGYWGDNSHTGMHTKISESGEVLWERFDRGRYGNSVGTMNIIRSVGVLSSGSIVSCGSTWIDEPVAYSEKSWLLKISPGGCIDDTDTLDCWAGAESPDATDTPILQADIAVYPNPVNDELTIVLTQVKSKDISIRFYDVTGRFLRKQPVRSGDNVLSVSDLPVGLLFYEVRDSGRLIGRGKLVKVE